MSPPSHAGRPRLPLGSPENRLHRGSHGISKRIRPARQRHRTGCHHLGAATQLPYLPHRFRSAAVWLRLQ